MLLAWVLRYARGTVHSQRKTLVSHRSPHNFKQRTAKRTTVFSPHLCNLTQVRLEATPQYNTKQLKNSFASTGTFYFALVDVTFTFYFFLFAVLCALIASLRSFFISRVKSS